MRKILIIVAVLLSQLSCTTSKQKVNFYAEGDSDALGYLFIIGGGERPDYLMLKLMSFAGEGEKNVIIVPFASSEQEITGAFQKEQFMRLGATSCEVLLCEKEDIDKQENIDKLSKANIIFFSGGDQNILTEYLNGTGFLAKIKSIYKEGGVIGGTSAGAAVMSRVMITGKEKNINSGNQDFVQIEKENIITADGFGFLDNVIVDQHFIYRKRQNRLFSVLLDNPGFRGVGIDESTAIIVKPNNTFEVIGESNVLVFEPVNLLVNKEMSPVFIIRILSSGDSYNL